MAEASRQYTHDDYTVGWICALPETELVAAGIILDIEHPVLSASDSKDSNSYLFGSIGAHNVVIACLPAQETGKVSAATLAKDMLRSFKAVRFGLMVGIGGGAPWYGDGDEDESDDSESQDLEEIRDIRLGDVVIGLHSKSTEAIEQYDFGKSMQGRGFVSAGGRLNKPPQIVLAAVSMLQGQHKRKGNNNISTLVSEKLLKYPGIVKEFSYPGLKKDRLFKADVLHVEGKKSCKSCCGPLNSNLVKRGERDGNVPKVHYGTIGSADQVMKDAIMRDKLAREKNIICFEMESAGLMDSFPCLVIRGICDYADSHKNKIWQPYAALTAAAYAQELLSVIPAAEIQKLPPIEVVEQINKNVEYVLQISHNTNAHLIDMKTDSHTARITRWLNFADPSTNINNARQSRHKGTGTWFLQSQSYKNWKNGSYQSLWIYGITGSGKSVLSATILDNLVEIDDVSTLTLAFFFDFRDEKKQKLNDMLCFLASQIYYLRPASRQPLDDLFASHQDGRQYPNADSISKCLAEMLKMVDQATFLIDALDECSERRQLLKWMKYFFPAQPHVRLLCTSRLEDEIQHSISGWIPTCVELKKDSVNADIRSYIQARLHTSTEFSRWLERPAVVEEIKTTLSSRADGMFRWAACQLDRLAGCLDYQAVQNTLLSLPSDLNETYARILENIPTERKDQTMRLIQFLVYSSRPLALEEAVDVVAVRVDEGDFNVNDRLPRPDEITGYGSSLVSFLKNSEDENSWSIQLAHFSVKEYFENCSEAVFIKPKPMAVITQTCLAYLGSIPMKEISQLRSDFPLARYAAETWMACARYAEVLPPILERIVSFLQNKEKFRLWASLYNPEDYSNHDPGKPKAQPLYYACLSGLKATVSILVSQRVKINARGGYYGTCLQVASNQGHLEIVRSLLENGADANIHYGCYGNALYLASARNHFQIVQLLLKNGAEINQKDRFFCSALHIALTKGNLETVQLLLENGADANTQDANNMYVLQAASFGGNLKIVKLLIENGANINAQSSDFSSALEIASYQGYLEIVQLLLKNGADVNIQGGYYATALQAALLNGHLEIGQLLLENGADSNIQAAPFEADLDLKYWILASPVGFEQWTEFCESVDGWDSGDTISEVEDGSSHRQRSQDEPSTL